MNRLLSRSLLPIALMGLVAGTARVDAGVTMYTSSTAFDAAISGFHTSVEDYGSLSNNMSVSAGQTIDGLTYSAFTPGPIGTLTGGIISDQFNSFSGLSLGGVQSTGQDYFFGGDSVTIDFAPTNAFGVFFNVNANSGDFGFTTSLGTATTGSSSFDTQTFVFAGLVSTGATFSSVTIFSTSTSLGSYNLPEIITASVPEPSSLALGAIGLVISSAAWAARRRRVCRDRTEKVPTA